MARPPKYNAEAPVWALRLCRLGATDTQLADAFGVAESTISRWKIEHPEFQEALKKGKAFADAEVADALFLSQLPIRQFTSMLSWSMMYALSQLPIRQFTPPSRLR